jgi:hypothetical protein
LLPRRRTHPILPLALVLVALTGCAPGPEPEPAEAPEAPKGPEALEAAGQFAEAAEAYARRAEKADGARAARLRLGQGRMLALAGRDTDSLRVLEDLTGTVAADAAALLRVRIHLRRQRFVDAHRILTRLLGRTGDLAALPDRMREEALDYRAQLQTAQGQPAAAFDALVDRHRLLGDEARAANVARIRYLLGTMPEKVLAQRTEEAGAGFPSGYLRFEQLMRRAARQPLAKTRADLQGWLKDYPGHALAAIVRERLERVQEAPLQVAVLLPLDSGYRPVADALLRGMLAAYYGSDRGAGIQLDVLDTGGTEQGLREALETVRAGDYAGMIGPLTPAGARALTRAPRADLPPALILNTTRNWAKSGSGLFQLGLDPEEEARQVAEFAYRTGHRRAGLLYPGTDWGRRMVTAFQKHWQELGGTTRAMRPFNPNQSDHSAALKALLDLEAVTERRQRLAATLGVNLPEYETPPRRDDLDFLFLASKTLNARLIKPQLEFFAAGDLPVLATSHVHSPGESRSDRRDMDGIRFLQPPWFLEPRPEHRSAARALGDGYPDQESGLERLNALGYDAYALVVGGWRRALLLGEPLDLALGRLSLEGATGRLSVTADGRVRRRLQWAEYRSGRINALPGMLAPGTGG